MRLIFAAALTLAPLTTYAAGTAPSTLEPEPEVVECEVEGQVWNPETEICEVPEDSDQSDAFLLDSAQRLAYAGAYGTAQDILKGVDAQEASRTLALWGYTHRKMGNVDLGLAFYDKALQADPNNILARSYLGEAKINMGDYDGALVELAEIRARGGSGSRAESLLLQAMQGGGSYDS